LVADLFPHGAGVVAGAAALSQVRCPASDRSELPSGAALQTAAIPRPDPLGPRLVGCRSLEARFGRHGWCLGGPAASDPTALVWCHGHSPPSGGRRSKLEVCPHRTACPRHLTCWRRWAAIASQGCATRREPQAGRPLCLQQLLGRAPRRTPPQLLGLVRQLALALSGEHRFLGVNRGRLRQAVHAGNPSAPAPWARCRPRSASTHLENHRAALQARKIRFMLKPGGAARWGGGHLRDHPATPGAVPGGARCLDDGGLVILRLSYRFGWNRPASSSSLRTLEAGEDRSGFDAARGWAKKAGLQRRAGTRVGLNAALAPATPTS